MATRKIQYPSVSRVIRIPVPDPVSIAATGFQDWPALVFPRTKPQQASFVNTPIISIDTGQLGGDFEDFGLPTRSKSTQFGFTSFIGDRGPAQTPPWFVFSTFSQPQSVKPVQQDFLDTPRLQVTPVVQTYLFSEFSQPKSTAKVFQENTFNDYEAVANYFFPVFADFNQPRFKQTIQDQSVQFTIFPITQVVSAPVFTGFTDFGIPATRKVQQPDVSGTLQQQIVAVVQPYVFSTFNQPFIKRQVNDQPTWFSSTVVLQPYVFSAFSQPKPLKYQTDANIQTSYYPVVIITPPNFTGFNDFGLAQQLLGTQRKQDGGYVQFTVLPMPPVVSPYFFTGFSSFQELLPNTSDRQRGLIGLGSSFDNVIIPVVQVPEVIVGGGGYRFMGGYHKYDKPQTIHTDAVRQAAAVLSKMGGEARAKALTPTQRSNIASTAANTRWNPKK